MISTGYYTINDIKSFFKYIDDVDDDLTEGDVLELTIKDFPRVILTIQVLDVIDGLMYCEIIEIEGETDDHEEGDLMVLPKEQFE